MVQNCVYGINSQTLDVSSFADLGGCVALGTASPGFNLDKNPNFPYYSLRRSSRACRAGTNAAAFAGTVDLAGNPRVHGEGPYTVDAGCYECWMPPTGQILIFR